jgi:RNA polymerase sigma-70 factor (ECF subfamily)
VKRGGPAQHLSLDWQSADERYHLEPPDISSPDRLYDRGWALALLERVIARLQVKYVAEGKGELFEHAKRFLMAPGEELPHARAAAALQLEEGALRVAVHRLRKQYREMVRTEIAQTLSDPSGVQEELNSLREALKV